MFDPRIEKPIPLTQCPSIDWLPRRRRGRKPHVSWFFRKAKEGLEVMRIGGALCTSEEALIRFFQRQTNPNVAATRTTSQRERAIVRAEAELAAAGI